MNVDLIAALIAQKATFADFRAIKRDLSERLSAEKALVIHTYHFDPEESVKQAIRRGEAETFLLHGQPIGLITWHREEDAVRTGFMATDEFFTPRPSLLRFSLKKIREIQSRAGGLVVRSRTLSTHPKLFHWYSMLGFYEVPAWPERVFELRPKT